MGHPDFRVNGRIFATLHHDRLWGMVKLSPEQQETFVRQYPAMYALESGAWGRQGCTAVRLKLVDRGNARRGADAGLAEHRQRARGKALEAEFYQGRFIIAQAMRGRTMSDIFPVLGLIVFGGAVLVVAQSGLGALYRRLDRLSRIEGKLDAL